jgi:hypothetical protein
MHLNGRLEVHTAMPMKMIVFRNVGKLLQLHGVTSQRTNYVVTCVTVRRDTDW